MENHLNVACNVYAFNEEIMAFQVAISCLHTFTLRILHPEMFRPHRQSFGNQYFMAWSRTQCPTGLPNWPIHPFPNLFFHHLPNNFCFFVRLFTMEKNLLITFLCRYHWNSLSLNQNTVIRVVNIPFSWANALFKAVKEFLLRNTMCFALFHNTRISVKSWSHFRLCELKVLMSQSYSFLFRD